MIPNKAFTFAKVWMAAAHLEVRQKDLTAARKILGMAIGERNKEKKQAKRWFPACITSQ